MNDGITPTRPVSYDKKVGLVLQGGGALGSYQGGVYEALSVSEYLPDWVAGISIGAINAAVIAGNAPEHRVQRLRTFWEEITAPTSLWHSALDGPIVEWQQWAGALTALMFGQPGFFEPRKPDDWFSSNQSVSYYKTSALKSTLERLIDFDRINHTKEMRSSVGAVNVRTGHFDYFDSEKITIRPEHGQYRRAFRRSRSTANNIGTEDCSPTRRSRTWWTITRGAALDLSSRRFPCARPRTDQSR